MHAQLSDAYAQGEPALSDDTVEGVFAANRTFSWSDRPLLEKYELLEWMRQYSATRERMGEFISTAWTCMAGGTATALPIQSDSESSILTQSSQSQNPGVRSELPLPLAASDGSSPAAFGAGSSGLPAHQDDAAGPESATRAAYTKGRRPFPLAGSVDAECRSLESRMQDYGCSRLREALTRFERELRDEGGASELEAQIREYLLAKQPGEEPIRALECRTTICVIECVPSISGQCSFAYEFTGPAGLMPHGYGDGYETTASGSRLVVSVLAFERSEKFK